MPLLMLRPDTTVDTTDTAPTAMASATTDTVPMATATPPTPDTATTTARGLLMPRPSPLLMLRPDTTVDTTATPLTAMVPTATDTVPTATATPPTPDTATTTARGPLMPSPLLMLRPDTTVDTTDTAPTAMASATT